MSSFKLSYIGQNISSSKQNNNNNNNNNNNKKGLLESFTKFFWGGGGVGVAQCPRPCRPVSYAYASNPD